MQQIKWNCIEHYIVIQHSSPPLSPFSSPPSFSHTLPVCTGALWGLVTNERKNVTHTINCIKCKKYCCLFDLLLLIVNSSDNVVLVAPLNKHYDPPFPLPTTSSTVLHAPANERTHARLSRGSQNGWQLNALYCMPRRGQWGERRSKGQGLYDTQCRPLAMSTYITMGRPSCALAARVQRVQRATFKRTWAADNNRRAAAAA